MTVTSTDTHTFQDSVRTYHEAFESRDLEKFAGFFREDAIKIDPDGSVARGKKQISQLFGGLFQMEFSSQIVETHAVVEKDVAVQASDIMLTFDDFEEHFYTVLTFTRDAEGSWMVLSAASTKIPAA